MLSRGLPNDDEYPPWWIPVNYPPVVLITPKGGTCYKPEYENSGPRSNGDNYKFEWSYKFRPTWKGNKVKTVVTMKNYKKNKKDKWVKDYGSHCSLGFTTQLYNDYRHSTKECIQASTSSNHKLYTKAHSKSTRFKANGLLTEWVPPSGIESGYYKTIGIVTCNPDESIITCVHRGTIFTINAATGNLQ